MPDAAANARHAEIIASELGLKRGAVAAALALLDDDATIPFIARYRKERTGEMDELQLRSVRDRVRQLRELDDRRRSILASLEERGLLSETLKREIEGAASRAELEDIYLPFRKKRETRADKARARGLEPLAEELVSGNVPDPAAAANAWILAHGNPNTDSADAVLHGARDIIAEWAAEDVELRRALRTLYQKHALIAAKRARAGGPHGDRTRGDSTRGAGTHQGSAEKSSEAASAFKDYFGWSEQVSRVKAHRIHAVLRGEAAGALKVSVRPEEERAVRTVAERHGAGEPLPPGQRRELERAAADAYTRLIAPSLETELKNELKARADEAAAAVFAENLRDLLMAPPLGPRRVMAVDPGYRTGCKVVCLDESGSLLASETIYPLEPKKMREAAEQTVRALLAKHRSEYIAVGNGTGGREAQQWLKSLFGNAAAEDAGANSSTGGASPAAAAGGTSKAGAASEPGAASMPAGRRAAAPAPVVVSVSEAGASVYSASAVARKELPEQDVTVRGAVSIGRRLIDPLSELVKIPPESIGVGQYQHDVTPKLLAARLTDTVVSCVNAVGVELNSASASLLSYVSGLSARQAAGIISHCAAHGPFRSRSELTAVSGIGEKAFEQAAGFLRIHGGSEPLDATAIHPERYELARRIAADIGEPLERIVATAAASREERGTLRSRVDPARYTDEHTGRATVADIIAELERPGRDPRPPYSDFAFREDVRGIEDLSEGMWLPGIVTNVTDFGAFVDIGVHRDGLVHVSALSTEFVTDPRTVVRVNQQVQVRVVSVDRDRARISLSMIPEEPPRT